jgi:hypothetical protein
MPWIKALRDAAGVGSTARRFDRPRASGSPAPAAVKLP